MSDRASPLAGLDEFAPKAKPASTNPDPVVQALVDEVAESTGFPSRQAQKPTMPSSSIANVAESRKQRRRRTGRNQQFNIKAKGETIERYNALCDRFGLVQGELLERALDAFARENKCEGI